jgi:ribulose 1,5-bisphosphate carboxylase large subunit-like protein
MDRVKLVADHGGNGVHINVWSGLGIYHSIRKAYPNIFIHFQKSGDRFFTDPRSPYHIKWPVICKLAGISGVDSIHAGMIGGYMNQSDEELAEALEVLRSYNVLPALSCGMHPGLVDYINDLVGIDWMANCGGAFHGHPGGTTAGGLAMRQAIDKTYGEEYHIAIKKWGLGPTEGAEYSVGNLFQVNKDLQYRTF